MRSRLLVLTAGLAATLSLVMSSPSSIAQAVRSSELNVSVNWGAPGQTDHWTLQCNPVGGTHPNRERACALLEGLAAPFAPLPTGMACSMVYSGPERARVSGRWHGTLVNTAFARNDGCATARWEQYKALFRDPTNVAIRGRVDLGPTCPVQRLGEACETIGAQANVTATSGSLRKKAQSGPDGFLLRLPRGVWAVTADAGMGCPILRIDTRAARVPSLVVIACDTGIRSAAH